MSTNDGIYLDYNATTPLDPAVFEAMKPYFIERFGNAASGQHTWGWTAQAGVEKARGQIAKLINSKPGEIFFNSGATEGNNHALFGIVREYQIKKEPVHLIVSTVEHSSVINTAKALQSMNVEVDFVPVNNQGLVDPAAVEALIKPHTRLISIIWVNNEIGTINPIAEIAAIARKHKVYLHTDGTQAVGKIPVDIQKIPVDLMTFSGHKIYGPKGIGGLYIRSQDPHVKIEPLIYGGGHEKGLRSGTLNVPAIVGLGQAAEICMNLEATEPARLEKMRNQFVEDLMENIPGVKLNGHPTLRAPNNMSLTFTGRPIDACMGGLMKLGFSTGSACSAGKTAISHVLAGLGLSEADATCTVRLSLGRWTTAEDLTRALEILTKVFKGPGSKSS